MSTREQVERLRDDDANWQPAELTLCPSCGVNKYLRSDSGLCERCHAVRPETIAEWQEWRDECSTNATRRNTPLPSDHCLACGRPWEADTQRLHDERCPARPFPCECGRRFWDRSALATHHRAHNCGWDVRLG